MRRGKRSFRMDPATTAGFFPEVFNMKFIVLERRGGHGESLPAVPPLVMWV